MTLWSASALTRMMIITYQILILKNLSFSDEQRYYFAATTIVFTITHTYMHGVHVNIYENSGIANMLQSGKKIRLVQKITLTLDKIHSLGTMESLLLVSCRFCAQSLHCDILMGN